jgi:FkbM family methyltransferase
MRLLSLAMLKQVAREAARFLIRARFGFPGQSARREISLFGYSVQVNIGEFHSQKMALGIFESQETAFLQRFISPTDTFLNVGANIGYYGYLAASRGACILMFEPIEWLAALVESNLTRNQIPSARVIARVCGSGEEPVRFIIQRDTGVSCVLPTGCESDNVGQVQPKSPLRIDTLHLRRCDVVVLDCEGYEWECLRGMEATLARCRPRLIMAELVEEFLRRHGYGVAEVVTWLRGRGYEPRWLVDGELVIPMAGRPVNDNYFFVRTPTA